jgi:protein-disulfide isomerase
MRMVLAAGAAGLALLALVVALPAGVPTAQTGEPGGVPDRAAIEEIVRDYIVNNPEIIEEALVALEERRMAEMREQQTAVVAELKDLIFDSEHQVVLGNPDGEVSLVEFFDYNCPYCRRALIDMLALMEANPDLRMVLKEWPILSEESVEAHRISVAVSALAPEAYLDFHRELLRRAGEASEATALEVAAELGLDTEELRRAAQRPEVDENLFEVQELAMALGISGTPTYVVGAELVVGAVGFDRLQAKVEEARRCGDGVAAC